LPLPLLKKERLAPTYAAQEQPLVNLLAITPAKQQDAPQKQQSILDIRVVLQKHAPILATLAIALACVFLLIAVAPTNAVSGTKLTRAIGGLFAGMMATLASYPLEHKQVEQQVSSTLSKGESVTAGKWSLRAWGWSMGAGLVANAGYFATFEAMQATTPILARTIAAAGISIALNTPLEVRKTRAMANAVLAKPSAENDESVAQTSSSSIVERAYRSWMCICANAANVIQTAVHFATYHFLSDFAAPWLTTAGGPAVFAASGALGAAAGIVAALISHPLHTIKALVLANSEQMAAVGPVRAMASTAQNVVKAQGWLGLYAGIGCAVARMLLPGTLMFLALPCLQGAVGAAFAQ